MNSISSSNLLGYPSQLLSSLNLEISSSSSLSGIPPVNTTASAPPLGIIPTIIAVGGHNQSQQFGLTKLTLSRFSGNPLYWVNLLGFLSSAIDLNPNLSGVQIFNYLKAQLEGDAARTIDQIQKVVIIAHLKKCAL